MDEHEASLTSEARGAIVRATRAAEYDQRPTTLVDFLTALSEPGSESSQALAAMGVTRRPQLSMPMIATVAASPSSENEILQLGNDQARRIGSSEIGTAEILVGILRVLGPQAIAILEWLGVPTPIAHAIAAQLLDIGAIEDDSSSNHETPIQSIALGQSRLNGTVAVELASLDIYLWGCVLMWNVRTRDRRLLGSPDLRIFDEVQTKYDWKPRPTNNDGHGGSGLVEFRPRPPDGARALHVEIAAFGEFLESTWSDGRAVQLERRLLETSIDMGPVPGPWVFDVSLLPRG